MDWVDPAGLRNLYFKIEDTAAAKKKRIEMTVTLEANFPTNISK